MEKALIYKQILLTSSLRKCMELSLENVYLRMQSGGVVSALDLQSGAPGFESRSGHLLDLFSVVSSSNPLPCL